MAAYLSNKEIQRNVWNDITELEKSLESYISAAYVYQNNTFQSHPQYYIEYFEMRAKQTNMLHNLHYEVKKIREMPKQAAVIAEYIEYMSAYVVEVNIPNEQLEKLEMMLEKLKEEELPVKKTELKAGRFYIIF